MKKIILIIILILNINTSCSKDKLIISNDGVGTFKLGELSNQNSKIKDLEVITDKNNIIQLIKLTSNKYKTKEGFGVGSNFNEIEKIYKETTRQPLDSSKGNIIIGNLGEALIHQNILFVDNNNDNKIDFIWVQNYKSR